MYNAEPVNDALLKKLSLETQLVGKHVIVKGWASEPESQAIIINVVILPFAIFYRKQFMTYYQTYKQNAVKALKELIRNYPNTHDYELDMGYVLNIKSDDKMPDINDVKHRNDFFLMEDLANRRQEILKSGLKVVKKNA